MPLLTEATEVIKTSQVVQVLLLLQEEDKTVEEACREVGIARSTYYAWARRAPDTIDVIREYIAEQQRVLMVRLMTAWQRGIFELANDAEAPHLKAKERVIVLKFLQTVLEGLLTEAHAQPGVEEAAHAFLKKGITLERQSSRMASLEAEDQPPESGLQVTVKVNHYQQILDLPSAEPSPPPEPGQQ